MMNKAQKVLHLCEKPKFVHGRLYYFNDDVDTEKRVSDWVEELYKIAAPEVGKKAIEWAWSEMEKFYGKLDKTMRAQVDKQLTQMGF